MCFAKDSNVPVAEKPVDRESEAAKAAYANAASRRRQAFGEAQTDIVGSIVANNNNPAPQVQTQLKQLMGG